MKKLLLTLTLALFGLNAMMAQSSLVATLSHEGNVSLFYGYNAFVDAMAAADHGDVITLSSGLFANTTVTKAVTIRGAAMYDDVEKGVLKTQLLGNMSINIPEETNGKTLTMEYFFVGQINNYSKNLQSPKFLHLRIDNISLGVNSDNCMINALFSGIDCVGMISSSQTSSFTVVNSRIKEVIYYSSSRQCNIINSVIYALGSVYNSSSNRKYINFKNCIFTNSSTVLDGSNSCDHCLAIVENGNADIFANIVGGTNWTVNSSSEIFTGEDNYVLTPNAAQTYLGTDGTQVGIWGGPMSWTTTADNPSITKCQVASRSTADGKLSVEIEVSGVQN